MPALTNPGPQGPSPRFRPPSPSKSSRNIALKSPASCRGALVLPGPRPRSCVFESALEEKTALAILARRDVVELVDQPEAVAYEVDGKRLEHTFDYLVTLRDGRRLAIAVKPERFVRSRGLVATMRTIAAQDAAYHRRRDRHGSARRRSIRCSWPTPGSSNRSAATHGRASTPPSSGRPPR